MRKLLSSPVQMALSETENTLYQNILKHAAELSLNLMAVKVENRPDNFLAWCEELYSLCQHKLNYDLLDPHQFVPLKKMQDLLIKGISVNRIKLLRITPWPIYFDYIEQQKSLHVLDERLRLLAYLKDLAATPLNELSRLDLLTVAGKHTADHDPAIYDFDLEWFGATKGAKLFQQLLQDQTADFAQALAHIPLEGEVTKSQYRQFVEAYEAIFSGYTLEKSGGEKASLFPATRLLAARRPDVFVVLNSAKLDIYCQGLAITKFNQFDFNGYWEDLVETLKAAAWWRSSFPENEQEQVIWQNRAILTDVFLFASDDLAEHSNLAKLKDRIANAANRKPSSSTARRRTKESAETIVDKRLEVGDLPEYMKGKREALVAEVKNGKSVDEAIRLFRAIFG